MCTETSLASHSRETSALRCLSAPRGRAACLCRAWGRAMKGMGRGQTRAGKGNISSVDVMCSLSKGKYLPIWKLPLCGFAHVLTTKNCIIVLKDCTGLAGVLAGGCWEMPKVPVLRWSVCAAKVIWCVIARVTDWPRVLLLLLGSQHCAAALEKPCSVPVTNIPLGMITRVPFLYSCWVCADKLTMPPHQTAQEGFSTQGSVLTVRQPDVRHPDLWHQGMCTHRCGTKQVLFLNVSEILYLVLEKKCSTPFFSNLFITWETLWKVQTKLKYNDTTEDLLCMWAFWTVGGSWFWTGGVIVIIGQHFWSTNLQGKFKI